jgi:hypothetical protein
MDEKLPKISGYCLNWLPIREMAMCVHEFYIPVPWVNSDLYRNLRLLNAEDIRKKTEATSLESKIPVFGKFQCSAKFFL